jgi:TonB-dependent starch-binding outer membrane protein SusC
MIQSLHKLPKVWLAGFFLLFLGITSLSAQDRRITGKVSDATGGLPGATIVQKGTSNGTTADIDGNFSLTVKGADPILVVSFTGFKTQEMAVGAQSAVAVLLEDSDALITETVVTGYTVDTRRQTTSAVATVKTRDLAAIPSGNIEQQLQGRVSGLTVITNGQPGTESLVRIRGFGSFGGNQPLYVVDGVSTQNVNFLSPDDIESTTVLKDASSASIYGARGAGGVIVITTKRGAKKPQKLQVSYDALYGVTDPGKGQEILNPQETADWTWKALKNTSVANGEATPTYTHAQYGNGSTPVIPDYLNVGGRAGLSSADIDLAEETKKYNVNPDNGGIYQIVRSNRAGTDWYGAITRSAPMTRHNLGFQGSTEEARFYVGLSLQDQSGILNYNEFKRYGFRANSEFDLGKRMRIGQNLQVTYRQSLGQIGGNGGGNVAQGENVILEAFRMPSVLPIYDEFNGYAGTAAAAFNNPRNPVAQRDGQKENRGFDIGTFGNFYAEIDLLKNLTFRSSIGGNTYNYSGFGFNRRSYENSENNSSFGYNEYSGNGLNWTLTNTAQYKEEFGNHKLEVLLGQEALKTGSGRYINASGLDPFSQNPNYVTLETVGNRNVSSGINVPVTYFSLFGRAHYSLMDKYYVTGVLRRDGSSRFGSTTRFGIFPAVSAAWRVSGEEFMQGVTWLEDFKIRGGWGQMGNDQVSPINQFSLFGTSLGAAAYDINGNSSSALPGFYQSRIGNPNAKWETSTTTNVGFEGLMFKGKFDIIIDLWKKVTSELIYVVPQPNVLGDYASAPAQNVGAMENKGIDLQIVNKGKLIGNSGYQLTLTGSWLNNKITKIADKFDYFDAFPESNRLAGTMVRNQVGQSISSFFGYQVVGIFNSATMVPDSVQAGAGLGRFKYADLDGYDDAGKLTGRPDGKIDAADRTFIGSPVPKFTGGINLKVTVGQFDVETYLYSSVGNKIFNLSKWFTDFYPSFTGAAISSRVKDSWSPENTGSENPIFEGASNFSTNTQPNSWYVEDGSFLRLQNITVGYNIPKTLTRKWNLSRARVYAATNNVATFTKYKGLDPAVGGAADTNFGIDVGNYPVTRSVMIGIGLTF